MTDTIRSLSPAHRPEPSRPPARHSAGHFVPAVAGIVLALAAGTAAAQTRAPVPPAAPGAEAPADTGTDCRPGSTAGGPCSGLTEKLDRSDGVLRPPAGIDPEIRTGAPAPDPGTMPVIRPGDLPAQPPQSTAR